MYGVTCNMQFPYKDRGMLLKPAWYRNTITFALVTLDGLREDFDYVLQVGLISDEKLIDLLDLALSADTVNTVKNLRMIMESGVEPLALMSQLATVITDILAGSYDYRKERRRRKFFRNQPCESKSLLEKSNSPFFFNNNFSNFHIRFQLYTYHRIIYVLFGVHHRNI